MASLVRRRPIFVYDDCTVRQAADHLLNHGVGRLPVVSRDDSTVIGMITRSDILSVFQGRMKEQRPQEPSLKMRIPGLKRSTRATNGPADLAEKG